MTRTSYFGWDVCCVLGPTSLVEFCSASSLK